MHGYNAQYNLSIELPNHGCSHQKQVKRSAVDAAREGQHHGHVSNGRNRGIIGRIRHVHKASGFFASTDE